jgi:hypothetical protein
LALRRNESLKFDISSFPDQNNRKYCLDKFGLHLQFASTDECYRAQHVLQPLYWRLICRFFNKHCPPIRKADGYFQEESLAFNPSIFATAITYATGYWQSEKYFSDISDIIRREFTVKKEPAGLNRQILAKIDSVNAVSLHIRRCDYVTNAVALKTLGALSLDYYFNALNIIIKQIKNPHVFVFSDNMQWAKENLKKSFPIYFLDYNDKDADFEDMRLMSRCKHNIIANSSFSWWGAWLNKNPDKIVIAPEKWFSEYDGNTLDLIPNKWLRI